jgi:hypothetical protein
VPAWSGPAPDYIGASERLSKRGAIGPPRIRQPQAEILQFRSRL